MESSYYFFTTCTTYEMVYWYPQYPHPLLYTSFFPNWCQNFSMLIIQWTDCMTIVTFRRWLENVTARCWNTHLVIFHWNDVKISRYVQKTLSHTTTWNIINFLISRTFKIKDFKGHYLKLVVLQDYTQFAFTNIVYFTKKIFLRSKSTSLTEVVNFLIFVTFKIKDFEGHYFKPVVLQGYT